MFAKRRFFQAFIFLLIGYIQAWSQVPQGGTSLRFGWTNVNLGNSYNNFGSYTYEAWIKPSSYGYWDHIMSHNENRYIYIDASTDSKVHFVVGNSTVVSDNVLDFFKWYHLAAVYDGSGQTMKMYVNGVLQADQKSGVASALPTSSLIIGDNNAGNFKGLIDEVKVFNTARTQSQINSDMASTTSDGAISYFKFDEGVGTALKDEVGTVTTAKVIGTTLDAPWAYSVTNTSDNVSLTGSIRWAILQANADTDKDYIDFSIQQAVATVAGASTITPTAELTVTQPIFIDGYSAYGSSPNTAPFLSPNNAQLRVQFDFSGLPGNSNPDPLYSGINLSGVTNSVIRGLAMYSVKSAWGSQYHVNFTNTTNSSLQGCYVGLRSDGSVPTKGMNGIGIGGTSTGDSIGGMKPESFNIISNTTFDGLQIGASGNFIANNYIGTDKTGNASAPNTSRGVAFTGNGNKLFHNLISGNGDNGVLIQVLASGNIVQGNYIGIKADQSGALANGSNGIRIQTGAINSIIGGTGANEPNIIAYNAANGVSIDGNATVNHKISGNSIFCNTTSGITLSSAGNTNKAAPVITTANTSMISGTCSAAGDIIEIFKDTLPSCGAVNQGKKYLGTAITTGTSWSYSGTFAGGDKTTATAYEVGKGTSPFSAEKLVECTAENGFVNFDDNSLSGFTATTGLLTPTVAGGQMTLNYAIPSNQAYSNFLTYTSPCLIDMSETDSAWVKLKVTTSKAVTIRVMLMDNLGYYTDGLSIASSLIKSLPVSSSAQEVAINFATLTSAYMKGSSVCNTATDPCKVDLSQIKAVLISVNFENNTATSGSLIIDNIQIGVPAVLAPTATAATNVTKNSFRANWTKTSTASYDLDVSTVKDFTSSLTTFPKTNISALAYDVTGLSANTVYYYRVRESGSTTWSNTKMTSTILPPGSGFGLAFNGASNYVEIGTAKDFDFVGSSSFTVEAWVKLDAAAIGKNVIYSKRSQIAPFNGFAIALNVVSGEVKLDVDCDNSTYERTISGFKFNEWYHIAVAFSANAYTVYINGVTHMYNPSNTLVSTTDKPRIGAYYNNADFFKGQIDEVKIWNTSRTNLEIQDKMCQKLKGDETGLVAYFRFDEASPSMTENKAKVSSMDGTMFGSPASPLSGAPIGDVSASNYVLGSTALNLTDGKGGFYNANDFNLGIDQGIQIYRVDDTPLYTAKGAGIDSLYTSSYFGLFPVGVASFTAGYQYNTNPKFDGIAVENGLKLARRDQNDSYPWNLLNNSIVNSTTNIVSSVSQTKRGEYMVAFTPPPVPGAALDFDGVDDQITVSDNDKLDLSNNFTLSAWVYNKDNQLNQKIIDKQNLNPVGGYGFGVSLNQEIWFTSYGKLDIKSPVNTLSLNKWYHIAVTYEDRPGGVKFYKDGKLVHVADGVGSIPVSSANLVIGSESGDLYWNGMLDEVQIWNRVLCEAEIFNNMGATKLQNKTGLVAQYSFNQGIAGGDNSSITLAVDSSGAMNNGTFSSTFVRNGLSSNFVAPSPVKSDSVAPNTAVCPPSAPTGLFAMSAKGRVILKWNKLSLTNGFDKYYIYGGNTTNPTALLDSTTAGQIADTSKTISGLTDGQIYYFRVAAKTTLGGVGDFSNEDQATPALCYGNVLSQNGTTNNVTAPHTAYNHPTTALTLETWVRFNSVSGVQYIISKGNNDGTNGQFGFVMVGGKLQFHFGDGSAGGKAAEATPVPSLVPNTWYHLSGSWNGSTATLFLNGNPLATASVSAPIPVVANPFNFGKLPANGAYNLNGQLDDVRLWNYGRSQAQIQASKDSILRGDEVGLVGLYHFDEPIGNTVAFDYSRYNNNATITGGSIVASTRLPVLTGIKTVLAGGTTQLSNSNAAVSWSSAATNIATVNATGLVTGVATGKSLITSTDNLGCVASDTLIVANKGAALDFDGVNDNVTIPHNVQFNTLPITAECWIKPTRSITCQEGIINKYISTSFNGWQLFRSDGKIRLFYYTGPNNTNFIDLSTTNVVGNDGGWHHVAMVIDQTGGKIYVDGNLSASGNWIGTPTACNNSTNISIGFYPGPVAPACNNNQFQGSIDEVRIWNRALCQAEIKNNKNFEKPVDQTGILARYDFNQGIAGVANGTETILKDSIGTNDGTLSGFSLSGNTSNWVAPGGVVAGSVNTNVVACPPPAPTSVCAKAGNASATISWNAVSNVKNGYKVIYTMVAADTANSSATFISSPLIPSASTTTTFTGLTNDQLYYFAVVSSGGDTSKWTAAVPVVESGNALKFNGSTTYVNTNLSDIGTGAFTAMAWAKMDSYAGSFPLILSKWDQKSDSTMEFVVGYNASAQKLYVQVNGVGYFPLTYKPALGEWFHLGVSYDGTVATIYLNGVAQGTMSGSRTTSNTTNIFLGWSADFASGRQWNGEIDEVAVFNTALSGTAINTMKDKPLLGNETGLLGVWHLDEPSGNIAYDASCNGNNGTKVGVPTVIASKAMFPFKPDSLKVVSGSLTWKPNIATDVKSYTILKKGTSTYDSVGTTTGATTSYSLPTTSCVNEYYKVLGIDNAGQVGLVSDSILVLPNSSLNNGLVAYYPFDGDVKDQITNISGIINGGVSPVVDRKGKTNGAYQFNGTNGFVNTNQILTWSTSASYSISFWLKQSFSPAQSQMILGKTNAFDYYISLDGRKVRYLNWQDGGALTNTEISSSATVNLLNNWHHVTIVFDAVALKTKLFMDGALSETVNTPIANTTNTGNLLIGYGTVGFTGNAPGQYFNGALDDIRFYNRSLGQEEIALLSESVVPDTLIACNLIGKQYSINATTISKATYAWSGQGTGTNQTISLKPLTKGNAGIYKVSVALGCVNFTDSVNLIVPAPDTAVVVTGQLDFCAGTTVKLASAVPSDSVVWLKKTSTGWKRTMNNKEIVLSDSATYYFRNYIGTCYDSSRVVKISYPAKLPYSKLTYSNKDTVFCSSTPFTMTAATGADTYQWYYGNQPILGANSNSYATQLSGVYRSIAQRGKCADTSQYVHLKAILPVETVLKTDKTSLCADDTATISVSAINGNSFSFKGDGNSYLAREDASWTYNGQLSLEFWMKAEKGNKGYIFSYKNPSLVNPLVAVSNPSSLTFSIITSLITFAPESFNSGIGVDDGQWHHILFAFSQGNTRASSILYVDGIAGKSHLFNSSGNLGSSQAFTGTFVVGQDKNSPTSTANSFKGELDEIRFWSATIDSATIKNNYRLRLKGGELSLFLLAHLNDTLESALAKEELQGYNLSINNVDIIEGGGVADGSNILPTYTWNNGVSATNTIKVTKSGTYSVGLDNGYCTATSQTIKIDKIDLSQYVTFLDDTVQSCNGDSVLLTAPITNANIRYDWGEGKSGTSIHAWKGIKKLTVDTLGGKCPTSDSVFVSIAKLPTISLPDTSICNSKSFTIESGIGANSGYGITWSDGSKKSSIDISKGGTYSIVIDSLKCSVSDTFTVSEKIFKASITNVATADTILCGQSNFTLRASVGKQYQWLNGLGNISSGTNTFYDAKNDGVYSVVIDSANCVDTSASVSLRFISKPDTVVLRGNYELCANDTLPDIVVSGIDTATYTLYIDKTLVSSSKTTPISLGGSIDNTKAGDYTLKVLQTISVCNSDTSHASLKIKPLPLAPIFDSTSITVCQFDPVSNIVLRSTVAPDKFSVKDGTSTLLKSNLSGVFLANELGVDVNNVGSSTFVGTQTVNGCESAESDSLVVDVLLRPTAPTLSFADSTNTSVCGGKVVGLVASGSNSYQWFRKIGADDYKIVGAIAANYNAVVNGVYSVASTSTQSLRCPTPNPEITVGSKVTNLSVSVSQSKNGDATLLTASNVSGSYQWFVDGKLIVGAKGHSFTTQYSGAYMVKVIYADYCAVFSDVANVFDASYQSASRMGVAVGDSALYLPEVNVGIGVYPNPFNSQLHISLPTSSDGMTISLTDINGKLLFEKQAIGSQTEIETSEWAAGMYLLKVSSAVKSEVYLVEKVK